MRPQCGGLREKHTSSGSIYASYSGDPRFRGYCKHPPVPTGLFNDSLMAVGEYLIQPDAYSAGMELRLAVTQLELEANDEVPHLSLMLSLSLL